MPITVLENKLHKYDRLISRQVPLPVLLLLLVYGCAIPIDGGILNERMSASPGYAVVLDVQNRSEYDTGHLPGAVNIPVYALAFRLDDIPARGKDEPVVVYCAHGPRAGLAAFILRLSGYSNVLHLRGDMPGWESDGLPVERP